VLSEDLLTIAPDRIREVNVLATVAGGAFIHDAPGFSESVR
jgi:predicted amidohydrolase YtcJ